MVLFVAAILLVFRNLLGFSSCVVVLLKGARLLGDMPEGIIWLYAPTNHRERSSFFSSLISFISKWDYRDFIIFGDFNVILSGDER